MADSDDEIIQTPSVGERLKAARETHLRRKDVADVEQVLRTQGKQLDREWIRQQLIAIFGQRDPRVSQWDDVARDTNQ